MRAFAKLSALALALAPVAVPAQPAGSLPPSEPDAIVAAVQSCRDAVTSERLDEDRLVAQGWGRGEISAGGASVDMPLRLFSREAIILIATPGSPGCIVTARLADISRYQHLTSGMIAAFGQPAQAARNGSSVVWFFDNRVMQLEPTGSRERPAVRIALIYSRSSQ